VNAAYLHNKRGSPGSLSLRHHVILNHSVQNLRVNVQDKLTMFAVAMVDSVPIPVHNAHLGWMMELLVSGSGYFVVGKFNCTGKQI